MEATQESLKQFKLSNEQKWHRTQSTVLDTLVHTPKVSKVLLVKRVSRLANVSSTFSTIVIRDLLDSKELRIVDESYISLRY